MPARRTHAKRQHAVAEMTANVAMVAKTATALAKIANAVIAARKEPVAVAEMTANVAMVAKTATALAKIANVVIAARNRPFCKPT
jgi:hypothetical protein